MVSLEDWGSSCSGGDLKIQTKEFGCDRTREEPYVLKQGIGVIKAVL